MQVDRAVQLDDDPVGEPGSIKRPRTFDNPWSVVREYDGPLIRNAGPAELKARAHSAIQQMAGTSDARREVMARMVDTEGDVDATIATHTLISSDPSYVAAFGEMVKHGNLAQLTDGEVKAARRAKNLARAMSLTTTAGGFLIPQQLDPNVILTSDGTVNGVRSHFRQVIATGNVWNGVATTEASWSVDGEAAEVSDDATTFANPQVNIYKIAGFIPISIEALEDEANVTEEIARILAMGKDSLESQLFVTGYGNCAAYRTGRHRRTVCDRLADRHVDRFGCVR